MTGRSATESEGALRKSLGVRELTASIITITIGGGVFLLPVGVAKSLGAAAWLAYVVCAVVFGLIVLCFAEAGSRVSTSGGPYAYVEQAFGPFVGYLTGVLSLLLGVFAHAAVAAGFTQAVNAVLDHVTVNLVKGGVITGRVTNQSGEPVIAINVSVARVRDGEGKAALGGGGRPATTDDRGIYRAYGLMAGTYLVSADSGMNSFPGSPYLGTVPVFHPSNTRDGATEVTMQAGGEASGIDIRYRLESGHVISGKVSGATPSGNALR